MEYSLFTDGGSRGNPGNAACGFFIFDEKDNLVDFGGKYVGETTNNVAEYHGLIAGLEQAKKIGLENIVCKLDSELVVKQLQLKYKVKDEKMQVLFKKVNELSANFSRISFTHIPRAENKFADKLVNVILDAR